MRSFILKINTLAMPSTFKRINSVVTSNSPVLELEFVEPLSKLKQKQFACYAGGGTADVVWESDYLVTIKTKIPLSARRFRYNCTMPSPNKNRYYWFSKQFIYDKKN
jgi:hypothetical protein